MTRPIIVARTMTPCTTEANQRVTAFLREQVGDECLLVVIPSHVELTLLEEGQSIPAGHVIHEKTVYVQVPRKSLWASIVALFPARKAKPTQAA